MAKHVPGHHSELDLAIMLGLSIWALRAWRRRGYGPPAVKFGKSVFYPQEAVRAFLQAPSVEGKLND